MSIDKTMKVVWFGSKYELQIKQLLVWKIMISEIIIYSPGVYPQ